jgi:hypothetical protein
MNFAKKHWAALILNLGMTYIQLVIWNNPKMAVLHLLILAGIAWYDGRIQQLDETTANLKLNAEHLEAINKELKSMSDAIDFIIELSEQGISDHTEIIERAKDANLKPAVMKVLNQRS